MTVTKFFNGLGLLLFLLVRGIALWILIPFTFLAWFLIHSWAQRVSIGQAVSWYDGTVSLLVIRGPLRPLIRVETEPKFLGISHMGTLPPFRFRQIFDLV